MGYELHIKRVSEAGHEGGARISREEWEEAVASESNLRIDSTATVVRNPRTGETITGCRYEGYTRSNHLRVWSQARSAKIVKYPN